MKFTAFFLLACYLQVGANGFGQNISLNLKGVPIDRAFKEIEKQSEFSFVYGKEQLLEVKKVNLFVSNATLSETLDKLFKDQPLSYTIAKKYIAIKMIRLNADGFVVSTAEPSPPIDVTGRLVNDNGQPLEGITVVVKGKNVGTKTNTDGVFSISVPDQKSVLVFSSVGYESKELRVDGKENLGNIVLSISNLKLNEIVVTGYSSQRRKDITGAVTVVNVSNLKSVPVGNPDQLLQGQASGVQVISSGQPGAESQINIRGITSFGNNDPLYIIDGVQASLHDINPNDIESIQVLKDAGSAAIYGVQGSNGVIVVTTKKGKGAKLSVSYDGYVGVQEPIGGNPLNLLNAEEMRQLAQKVAVNNPFYGPNWVIPDYIYSDQTTGVRATASAGDPAVDPSKYVFTPDHSADYFIVKTNKAGTDWFHEVFNPALQQSHTVSVNSGSDKGSFLFSFNYLNHQGTATNTFLKRYSVRVNTTATIKNVIRVGENAYFFFKNNPLIPNQWENGIISGIYGAAPVLPIRDIAGNYAGAWDGPGLGNVGNPVADLDRTGTNKSNVWDIIGNVFAEVDVLKHLTARTSFGGTIDNQYNYNFSFTPYESFESHNLANGFTENSAYNSTWLWTNTLSYSNTFAKKHSIKALVGTEAKSYYGRGVGGGSKNFSATLASDPNFWILNNGTQGITNYSYANASSLYSIFGKIDYAFDNKYLLSATLRRDGASVLAKEVRYGNFPSVSLGWRLSQEDFLKSITWINDLKLRASWGKLGSVLNVNAANSVNTYGQSTQSSFYDITGSSNSTVPGYLQTQVGNGATTWEKDEIKNIGIDAVLFNNKLDLTAEYFIKSVDGLLFQYNFPAAGVGFATYPVVNGANIQNKGVDLSATYHGNVNKDLTFDVGLNFSSYKNKVLAIPNPGYFDAAASRQGQLVRNLPGSAVGSFFGYKVIGLYHDSLQIKGLPYQVDAAPGRFIYQDRDGNDTINANDRSVIGNPNPDFTYGLNLSVSYKNWSLGAFFYGSQGNDIYNEVRYWTDFYGSFPVTKSKDLLYNSWTPTNLNAKTPVIEQNGSQSTNNSSSSYFIENGSFFKCRYVKLAYKFSPKLLKRVGVDNFSLYVQAANLFTITKYTGLDPELISAGGAANPGYATNASFGIDYGNYPNNQRSYLVGFNVSF
ncbi:MAG: TonB-dependent receptor [Ferruginibacter sp.]